MTPPLNARGHATSGAMVAKAASKSRALNAAYAARSNSTSGEGRPGMKNPKVDASQPNERSLNQFAVTIGWYRGLVNERQQGDAAATGRVEPRLSRPWQ